MRKTKKNSNHLIIILTLMVVLFAVLLLGLMASLFQKDHQSVESPAQTSLQGTSATTVYDELEGQTLYFDEDFVYIPEEKNIVTDEENGIVYCNNLLNVYLWDGLKDDEAQKVADLVNGVVGGYIGSPINLLQIRISETSLNTIRLLTERLNQDERVLFACEEIPIQLDENTDSSVSEVLAQDHNPWGNEADKGNEVNPGGNDWWAEAIGAYTAWRYDDLSNQCENPDNRIKIGVLDSGYYLDQLSVEELHLCPETLQTPDAHGTAVVRIMAEKNDTAGLRGIFDHAVIYASDFAHKYESKSFNHINSGFFTVLLKMQIDNGVKVLNNSWGCNSTYLSYEEYLRNPDNQGASVEDYHRAVSSNIECINSWTKSCLMFMLQELRGSTGGFNGSADFVVVQSAGNGSAWDDTALEAEANGGFCMITEAFYNDLFDETSRDALAKDGVTFDAIKKRIAVVAAVKNRNSDGQYHLRDSSGYGRQVTLCAPGEDIFLGSPIVQDGAANSGTFWYEGGTSLAAPMVSASIGYLLSLDADLTAPEALQLLVDTANTAYPSQSAFDCREDYPMLNIGKAANTLMQAVENNGGNVVGYQNNVYYWQFSPEAMSATGQNIFFFNADTYSTLICMAPDGTKQELLTDCAQGPIYISGDYLYYKRTFNSWGIYHIPTGQTGRLEGEVIGVNALTGGCFVTRSYEVYACSPGEENVQLPFDSTQIMGVYDDGIWITNTDELGIKFYRVSKDLSDCQELGSIPFVNTIGSSVVRVIRGKDSLFLNIGNIQGTGQFYSGQLYKLACDGSGVTTLVSGTGDDKVGLSDFSYANTPEGEVLYYYGGASLAYEGQTYSFNAIDHHIKRIVVSSGSVSDSDFALDWNGSIISDGQLLYRRYGSEMYQEILNVSQLPDGFDSLGESALSNGATKYTIPYRIDVVSGTIYVTLMEKTKASFNLTRYISFDRGTSKMLAITGDTVETVFDFSPR